MPKFERKKFKKKEPYLYVAKKDRKKEVVEGVGHNKVLQQPTPVKIENFKDERLDEIVPLFVEMVGRLLSSGGMMRYRSDLIKKTKEIMREKENTKAK